MTCLVIGAVTADWIAPAWAQANGLDFWNLGNEQALLRSEINEGRSWDNAHEQVQRRREATQHIVQRLCEGGITLNEALDATSAMAQTYPGWLASLKVSYSNGRVLPPTATDRDVLTCYLLTTIKGKLLTAEELNETSRSAFLSACLARLTKEARVHAKQASVSAAAH
jgi:hypothetical protein